MAREVTLRPAAPADVDWLVVLRMRTMEPHLRRAGEEVSPADHRARVLHDFDCIQIVLADAEPIGMMKVVREPHRWRLVQVQLVPEWQGRGIGGRIIGELLGDARRWNLPVVLSVLKVNPAKRLYDRLGFRVVGEGERAYEMQRTPEWPVTRDAPV